MRPHARAVVCAGLLPVALLVADPSGYSPFGPSKWAAITVVGLAAVALAVWAGRLWVARWPLVVWLFFLGWLVVTALVGLDPFYAWIGTPQRHFGVFTWVLCFLLFLVGQSLDDHGEARLVVGAAVAGGGLAGAWALAEKLGWRPIPVPAGGRLIGSLGSAAFLGAAMALVVPMAVGVAADGSWGRRYRVAAGGCAALAALALAGSGARAAWAGSLIALSAVVVTQWPKIKSRPRGAAALAAAAALVVGGLVVFTGVAGRVPALFDNRSAGGVSRLDEWQVATKVLAHHPLTGVGPEGYRIALPEGLDAHYVATYGLSPLPDRAHDSLLDVAVTTGLPGGAAYVVLLALVGAFVLRALRNKPLWLAGVAVGIVAYAAQGLALFPLAELDPAVWLLAGLVVAQVARPAQLVEIHPPRPVALLVAVLTVIALVAGGRDVLADRATRRALAALASGDDLTAQRDAARAAALRPDQIEYWLAAEQADTAPDTLRALARGLADLNRARGFSPNDPVVQDERGRLLLARALRSGSPADLAAARADLAALVAADPFDAQDQLRLGVADAQGGDAGAAEQAWRAAERLAPSSAAAATDLAVLWAAEQRWSDAAGAARQALRRDPSDAQAQSVLAETARHLGT